MSNPAFHESFFSDMAAYDDDHYLDPYEIPEGYDGPPVVAEVDPWTLTFDGPPPF